MGLGSGAYLMAGFNVVEMMVGPEELSNAVSFMAIGMSSHLSYLISALPLGFRKKVHIH